MRLVVTIRDDTPMRLFGDAPKYRTVTIELTADQNRALACAHIGVWGGTNVYEEIADYVLDGDSMKEPPR